jgi:hypothetical protein
VSGHAPVALPRAGGWCRAGQGPRSKTDGWGRAAGAAAPNGHGWDGARHTCAQKNYLSMAAQRGSIVRGLHAKKNTRLWEGLGVNFASTVGFPSQGPKGTLARKR